MEMILSKFLQEYCQEKPPLLIGLSGGPDSMALFWLLAQEKYTFEVAHIDHGWRGESAEEAQKLAEMCQNQGIPCHLKRLEAVGTKNLEEAGRDARLTFFKELIEKRALAGVILGHQADDQAETVLKRVFEGASLPKLKGLTPKTVLNGLTIYRPLLSVPKKEIIHWLDQKKIAYFRDPTNSDPRFLRSRLRENVIPLLAEHFGKEIAANLCKLGESAEELRTFLDEMARPFRERIRCEDETMALNFEPDPPQSHFLWKVLIRDFFDQKRISLSNPILMTILTHLQKGSCHKTLQVGKYKVVIHRGELKLFMSCDGKANTI